MNQELKAILTEEEGLNASVEIEKLRGLQGYSAYEIYLKNLPKEEVPLTEEEWLNSISKANYYEKHEFSYTAVENTKRIYMERDLRPTDIVIVKINGLDLIEGMDYTISNNSIILTEFLEVGNILYYAIFRTVVATNEDYEKLRGERGFGAICWNDEEDSFDYEQLREDVDNNIDDIDTINNKLKDFSLKTEAGTTLDVTMNESNFVVTFKLKNESGTVLSTQSIDLPLETLVLNTTYDNNTKELVITLQNGTVTKVPISGLLSGVVTEETFNETIKNCITSATFESYKKANEEINENIRKDIDDNTSRIKRLETNLDVGEASGEAINVKDSAYSEGIEIESTGGWKQETTKGLNIVNLDKSNLTYNNVDTYNFENDLLLMSSNSNKYKSVQINITNLFKNNVGKIFTFSYDNLNLSNYTGINNSLIRIRDKHNNMFVLLTSALIKERYTIPNMTDDDTYSLELLCSGSEDAASEVIYDKLMFYFDEGQGVEYEPYTDGPSPSFDSEQPIEVIESGDYEFTTTNKNIYNYVDTKLSSVFGLSILRNEDGSFHITGTPDRDYISLIGGIDITDKLIDKENYTLSQNIPAYVYAQIKAIPLKTSDNTMWIYSSNSQTRKKISFTVDKSKYIYRLGVQSGLASAVGQNIDITLNFQLEQGNEATDFVEYQNSKLPFTIPEGEFFASQTKNWGDKLYTKFNEEDKKTYLFLEKNILRRIIDENTNIKVQSINSNGIVNFQITIPSDQQASNKWEDTLLSKSNYLTYDNTLIVEAEKEGLYINADNIYIRAKVTRFANLEALKEFLREHPIIVYYKTSKPYILDLRIKDMLLTFLNETNLFNNFPLPVGMSFKYYRNPHQTIEQLQENWRTAQQDIVKLQSDVANLQEQVSTIMSSMLQTESEVIEDDIPNE